MIHLTGNLWRRTGPAQVSGLIEGIFDLEHFDPELFRLEPVAPACGIAIESNQFALT